MAIDYPAQAEREMPVDLMMTDRPEAGLVLSKEQVRAAMAGASIRLLDEVSITVLAEGGPIVG